MKFFIKNIFFSVFLLNLLSHKSFAMDRYLMKEEKKEFIQILDQLTPMQELKPIHKLTSRSRPLKTKQAEKWMEALVFQKIPKIILMNIMDYFSFSDLENLTKVSGFFVFAEHRLRLIAEEMEDGISKIYITPESLLSTYSEKNLEYFLEYYIIRYKKKIFQAFCHDFCLDNGEFSLRKAYLSALDHYANIRLLCIYLKTKIALNNTKLIEDFCRTELKDLNLRKRGIFDYIDLVVWGHHMRSLSDDENKFLIIHTIPGKGEVIRYLKKNRAPLCGAFFNFKLREIDWVRKNMIFFPKIIALKNDIDLGKNTAIAIEAIVQDWINSPLKKFRECTSKEQQEYISHHPQFKILCNLIKLNAKLSYRGYDFLHFDDKIFLKTPLIIKYFIPEKKLARDYLRIMSQNFISFKYTPILFTYDALKEIVNLEEIEELMKILQPLVKKNEPRDFNSLDLIYKPIKENKREIKKNKSEIQFFKIQPPQSCLIL